MHIHNIRFYGEISKIFTLYHFDSDPRFSPFLLYSRWKSGVTFVRRCFRDVTCFAMKLEKISNADHTNYKNNVIVGSVTFLLSFEYFSVAYHGNYRSCARSEFVPCWCILITHAYFLYILILCTKEPLQIFRAKLAP